MNELFPGGVKMREGTRIGATNVSILIILTLCYSATVFTG